MYSAEKVHAWMQMMEKQTHDRYLSQGFDPSWHDYTPSIRTNGSKYTGVAIGGSMRYFVRKATGEIFAAATFRAPNFNRSFGTLDTVNDFNWGDYSPRLHEEASARWTMKHTAMGYFTAVPV